jgi:orotate phosphoribosyltransferase
VSRETKRQLALDLFGIGAIKFGAFRLKLHETHPDAPLSPIYVDLRILRSFPRVLGISSKVYQELTSGLKFDVFADVPTAATPIVAVLSYETGIPMISPRKEEKTHGIKRQIDGVFKQGQVALLIDDLVTQAESKLETISILEENGLKVHDVAVLVDREQGGVKQLESKGYSCHAAFKLRELLKLYLDLQKITPEKYEQVITYLERN